MFIHPCKTLYYLLINQFDKWNLTIKLKSYRMIRSCFLLALALSLCVIGTNGLYFQFLKPGEKCLYEDLPREEVLEFLEKLIYRSLLATMKIWTQM